MENIIPNQGLLIWELPQLCAFWRVLKVLYMLIVSAGSLVCLFEGTHFWVWLYKKTKKTTAISPPPKIPKKRTRTDM